MKYSCLVFFVSFTVSIWLCSSALTGSDCIIPAFWNAQTNSCYEYITDIFLTWYDGQRTCRALSRKKYLSKARGRLAHFPTSASLTSDFTTHYPSGKQFWVGLIRKPGTADDTAAISDHMWAEYAENRTLIDGPELSWQPTSIDISDRKDDCVRMASVDDWGDRGCNHDNEYYILCEFVGDTSHAGSCRNYGLTAGLRAKDGQVIANSSAATLQECAERCNANAQCLAVSYPRGGGDDCRLSAHIPSERNGMFDTDGSWDSYALI